MDEEIKQGQSSTETKVLCFVWETRPLYKSPTLILAVCLISTTTDYVCYCCFKQHFVIIPVLFHLQLERFPVACIQGNRCLAKDAIM